MSWLSSLAGSVANTVISASASALSKGNSIPGLSNYALGDKIYQFDQRSIWTLYHGIKKDDQSPVTVFSFDLHSPSSQTASSSSYHAPNPNERKSQLHLAKNALRKLRTLRHPHILKFLDGSDTDTSVWIVTEPVKSLSLELDSTGPPSISIESKIFGLLHLCTAIAFLNKDGKSIHANLRPESVWITNGGEWKLGGMELTTRKDEDDGVLWNYAGLIPEARTYTSPEVRRGGWTALKEHEPSALDSYQLYLLIYVIFNGTLPVTFSSSSDSPPSLPTTRGNIPQNIFATWRRLGNPNPKPRLRTDTFLELGLGSESGSPGWWPLNRLVKLSSALEGFSLASETEKLGLIKMLKDVSDASQNNNNNRKSSTTTSSGATEPLPDGYLKYKVLPSLVTTFEFGGGGPAVLPLILNLSSGLPEKEYTSTVIQPLVRMFATPDRATRMALLEGLDKFADKLTNKDVTEKIWPHLMTGFGDVVPVIREATVKSILLIAPKLSERILNNDLLRLLARTQTDPEPGIRTNTCILLGRLSRHLQPSTNRKVLVPAFARALRDPFIHARIAGLMALMATAEIYEKEDLAGKVIPAMSICLIDREKAVRDQGYKAIDLFVKKCEALTLNMPETAATTDENGNPIIPGAAGATNSAMAMKAASSTQPGIATNAAGAAGALAGWAFASVSKKLSSAEAAAPIEARSSTPSTPAMTAPTSPDPAPASRSNGHASRASVSSSRYSSSKPLQSSSLVPPGGFDGDDDDDDEEDGQNGATEDWGQDLMDVNADDDDWDQFESGAQPPKVDPLAARLSSTRAKGALKLGGATKSSALKIPIDLDATDSWDIDESSTTNKPVSIATIRKPAPNLMASAIPAGPKQKVSLAPRPQRAPVVLPVNTSPRKPIVPVSRTSTGGAPIPIRTTPLSPSRSSVISTPKSPPPPVVPVAEPQYTTPRPSSSLSSSISLAPAAPQVFDEPETIFTPPPIDLEPNPFASIESASPASPPPPVRRSVSSIPAQPESQARARSITPTNSIMSGHDPVGMNGSGSIDESNSTSGIEGGAGAGAETGATVWMTKEEKMAAAREARRLRMAQAKAGKK